MSKSLKTPAALLTIAALAASSLAQRPQLVETAPEKKVATTQQVKPESTALTSVKARYEGGVAGFPRKVVGTLSLDKANERLVFRNDKQSEIISIPYLSIVSATPDVQSRSALGPVTGTVASTAGIWALPALLAKRKFRFLNLQYNDPHTRMAGVTSFKIDGKELLNSFAGSLAGQAGLSVRGEGFVRMPKPVTYVVGEPIFSKPRASARSTIVNGKAITLPQPVYPQRAMDAGAEGTITVYVTIDYKGDVIEAHVSSGGHPILEEAALEAAKQAKFEPAQVDGQPALVTAIITYRFTL